MDKMNTLEKYALRSSRTKTEFKRYGTALLFLAPFILSFILFFIVPLIYGVRISFMNFKFSSPGTASYNGAQWYKFIFAPQSVGGKLSKAATNASAAFWRSFLHSFIFALIMVPLAVLVPLGLAILVNIKPPGYKIFRALIYMPSIVPLTAAGTIFSMLFLDRSQHGLLNEILGTDIKWFVDSWFKFTIGNFNGDVALAWIPIFLMCFWGGWGGNFIILSAGLQNIPKSLYEASDIDGASPMKRVMAVTIPGIKGQLVLCLFTTIIGYLGLYGQNYVLSNGGPVIPALSSMPGGGKTSTIMYFIQDIVANRPTFKDTLYGLGAAASIVYAILVGIISGIQMWATRDRKPGNRNSEAYAKWARIN